MTKPIYEIDGMDFSTLEEFFDEVSRVLIPNAKWGHNLDAFNDILRGGFGTPDTGFMIRWKNSELSRERLGYAETTRQLELRLLKCHPSNRDIVQQEIDKTGEHHGSTVFDWLIEIINVHCAGGEEEADGVELLLA